eukprot:TRINITY_DN2231_c0_g1_i1.p1 TRINITY_DN2231_c0_g1~~TRINITY_DN2231_c0_g1_i1.p1  ORF type:complete len:319 (+),score=133.34 TRINITY_DN2231_c0_g1_i1:57-959(+)
MSDSDKQNDPDLIPADELTPLEMGDNSKEVSDEDRDEAQSIKNEAMDAQREGKLEDALNLFTKAIQKNPKSGLFYAFRAQVLLELKRPNAAIRDCDAAIKINPDSAKPYKIRGRANRVLGNYEVALRDVQQGQKLDFDETTQKLEAELKPRAEVFIQKKLEAEREAREKEKQEREERIKKVQEARAEAARKAKEEEEKAEQGGFGGADTPFGLPPDIINKILSDPEMMEAMNDPEFMTKLGDIQSDPANIAKYQNDAKVMNLVKKFSSLFSDQFNQFGGGAAQEEAEDQTPNVPSVEEVD